MLATLEHNYAVPGVLKNALDWGSRPYGDNGWDGKPVGIMSASVGSLGAARAQYQLWQMFVFLNMFPLNRPEVMIADAADKVDEQGMPKDAKTLETITELVEALVAWTQALGRRTRAPGLLLIRRSLTAMRRWNMNEDRHQCGVFIVPWMLFLALVLLLPASAAAEGARALVLPLRPFGLDVAFRQSFTPHGREIGLQASLTALHYGDLEVRATYQYFGFASSERNADVHSLYANPRWNNFLDVLDLPNGWAIGRTVRHLLFGPLADRAVPYLGVVGGAVLSGPGHETPTYVYGAQGGVRFPVGHSISLDLSLWYFAYGVNFGGHGDRERQLLFTTGLVF